MLTWSRQVPTDFVFFVWPFSFLSNQGGHAVRPYRLPRFIVGADLCVRPGWDFNIYVIFINL
jgi:hypothetical protein